MWFKTSGRRKKAFEDEAVDRKKPIDLGEGTQSIKDRYKPQEPEKSTTPSKSKIETGGGAVKGRYKPGESSNSEASPKKPIEIEGVSGSIKDR